MDHQRRKPRVPPILQWFLAFLPVPVVGTLAHELGHYFVALVLGYDARIAYAFTLSSVAADRESAAYFWFILGGPMATWIQSLAGVALLFLYLRHERVRQAEAVAHLIGTKRVEAAGATVPPAAVDAVDMEDALRKGPTPALVATLGPASFCGRFVFNAASHLLSPSARLDEYKIGRFLGLPPGLFIYGFAILGLVLLGLVLWRLPPGRRRPILLGGVTGAAIGYLLWFQVFGPIVLPV